ncbi:MAG: GspMb/PilO family protein [Opitutales bacterium]
MSKIWDKVRAFYKRTSLREKLLTLAFILVILVLWGNNWLDRLSTWNDLRKFSANELEFQKTTLERGPEITNGLKRALARVDPDKTYDAARLSERVDSLLRSAGLSTKADIDPVRPREGEIFNDYNLRVRLNRVTIEELVKINALLKQDTPYINIESVRIAANRRNPEELDVRFEINSFDLKEQIL